MSDLLIYAIKDSARMVRYVITDEIKVKDFLEHHESEAVRLQIDEYIDGCYSAESFLSEQLGDRVVFALREKE